ncbi:MAG: glutathione S-transferase family protein [Hydrotalea sp.]|nr:glutathione S-transferase family protein [Hydrotalea sp.]
MKLYGRIGTGVAAVEALFHELEVPHEYVEVPVSNDGSYRLDPAFLGINPMGQVPYIECDDGTTMAESAAMMVAIADRFGRNKMVSHGLYIPSADDPTRNAYMRWMVFFASGVYYHHLFYAYSNRYVSSPTAQGELRTNSLRELDRLFDFASSQLGNQPYFLGEDCSPFDLYAAMLFAWHPDWATFAKKKPLIKEFCKRIFTRPKSQKTWEKHELLGLVQ